MTLSESDLIFPLLMRPHFDPRPWGGNRLAELYGKIPPPGAAITGPIGETWEVSAIEGKVSHVDGGPLDGMAFDQVLRTWPLATLGRLAGKEFPLLVKFIDAAEPLSVQVHPDDVAAQRLENYPMGKTEAWLILDAAKGTDLILGLTGEATRHDIKAAADSPAIERYLRRVPIRPGTVVPVTAGTVHAILSGTVLCEVQQSCDITYRVYDWNRQPPRALHVEKSLESIHFGEAPPDIFEVPPAKTPPAQRPLSFLDMNYFSLGRVDLAGDGSRDRVDMGDGDFAIAICLEDGGSDIEIAGRGADETPASAIRVRAGHCVFLPAAMRSAYFCAAAPARFLWVRPGL